MSAERLPFDEEILREKLNKNPADWEVRRQLAHGLYDQQRYEDAAKVIWKAEQIPSTDLDLAFAARILAKEMPRRAIRLLTAVLELNRGKAVQNMGMANALLHHGMVLQASRFYGAALEADPTLANPELEHFVLWTDDECTLWGDFEKRRPKLGELPWMLRDPKEALKLTNRVSMHTTPIAVPNLAGVPGEELKNDLYKQEAMKNGKISPPPAVTIPMDRVDPKHRRFDSTYGATVANQDDTATPAAPAPAAPVAPIIPAATRTPATPKPTTSAHAQVAPKEETTQAPEQPTSAPPSVPLVPAATNSDPNQPETPQASSGPRTRKLVFPSAPPARPGHGDNSRKK